MRELRMRRIGVDVGGTFTDLICVDDTTGRITVDRVAATPDDPSRAAVVADATARLRASRITEPARA